MRWSEPIDRVAYATRNPTPSGNERLTPPDPEGWWRAPYLVTPFEQFSPIIIGGCACSGVDVLGDLLHQHCNLACGPASELLLPSADAWTTRYHNLERLARWYNIPTDLVQQWLANCDSQAEFVVRWKRYHTERKPLPLGRGWLCSPLRWIDATPANVRVMRRVWDWWPLAKFVHVIRDGRDVISELRRYPLTRENEHGQQVPTNNANNWQGCAAQWVYDVQQGLGLFSHGSYYAVRYEDLLRQPDQTLRALLAWLGEPWDGSVIRVLSTRSIGLWREALPVRVLEMFRKRAGKTMIQLRYVPGNYVDRKVW